MDKETTSKTPDEKNVDDVQALEPKESTVGTETQAENKPNVTTPSSDKKKRKMWLIGGIVAAAVVVLSGSGALAYNLWYQNPDKVVGDAMLNALRARTYTGAGTMSYKADDYTMNLTVDTKAVSNAGSMNVKADIEAGKGEDKVNFSVHGSALLKDKTLYFKLDKVQETVNSLKKAYGEEGFPDYLNTIIKKIDGQWISAKASDYEELDKESAKQQECFYGVIDKIEADKEMGNEVAKLYSENKFVAIKDSLGSKSVDGVGSLGYTVTGDEAALEKFVRGLSDTKIGKAFQECDKEIDFNKAADSIAKESKDNKTEETTEIWVSRFGHELTQVKADFKDEEATGAIEFNTKFNTDVSVEAPEGAISMKDLMKDIEKAMEKYYEQQMMDAMRQYQGEDVDLSEYNFN